MSLELKDRESRQETKVDTHVEIIEQVSTVLLVLDRSVGDTL